MVAPALSLHKETAMSPYHPRKLSITGIVLAAVALVAAAGEFWFALEMAVHIL
jgi:hypothetical protein